MLAFIMLLINMNTTMDGMTTLFADDVMIERTVKDEDDCTVEDVVRSKQDLQIQPNVRNDVPNKKNTNYWR